VPRVETVRPQHGCLKLFLHQLLAALPYHSGQDKLIQPAAGDDVVHEILGGMPHRLAAAYLRPRAVDTQDLLQPLCQDAMLLCPLLGNDRLRHGLHALRISGNPGFDQVDEKVSARHG
jgi:hypothetical protein